MAPAARHTWSTKENERLKRVVEVEESDARKNNRIISWQHIAERFNSGRHPDRQLKREQIYQQYYHLNEFKSQCTVAEVEVVQALLELALPDELICKFLENGFRDAKSLERVLSLAKEDKPREPRQGTEPEDERRLQFRRKVSHYVEEMLKEEEGISDEHVKEVRMWVSNDPSFKYT